VRAERSYEKTRAFSERGDTGRDEEGVSLRGVRGERREDDEGEGVEYNERERP